MNKDPQNLIDDDDDLEGYRKIDHYNHDSLNKLSQSYFEVLQNLGENTSREGILKTPERVAKAMQFLTQGYHLNKQRNFRIGTLSRRLQTNGYCKRH